MGKPESLLSYVKDRPGHDRRYALRCQKMEDELGWKPAIALSKMDCVRRSTGTSEMGSGCEVCAEGNIAPITKNIMRIAIHRCVRLHPPAHRRPDAVHGAVFGSPFSDSSSDSSSGS